MRGISSFPHVPTKFAAVMNGVIIAVHVKAVPIAGGVLFTLIWK